MSCLQLRRQSLLPVRKTEVAIPTILNVIVKTEYEDLILKISNLMNV